LRGSFAQPLAIIAPGLGGWMHEMLLYNAARYFDKKGIATLRVSLYGDEPDQRDSVDCDVYTHG
jgi:alpha/beta superfamily hydrolase